MSDEDVVGQKRAGLACLPNGRIRWGELGVGGSMDQRELVQDTLEDEGVPMIPLGDYGGGSAARPVLRLRAVVKSADFRLCAKRWIGDAKALSGEVHLVVEWRAESRNAEGVERSHVSNVVRTIDPDHAAPLASLYRGLLRAAAKDVAAWLKAPGS